MIFSPLRRARALGARTLGTAKHLRAPTVKPECPEFSSGPCTKRPGYTLDALQDAALGRSHRSAIGKAKLAECIDLTRKTLSVPDDYLIGIVPASDTGAVEMAMWNMFGKLPIDVFFWEAFGKTWMQDCEDHLRASGTLPLGMRSFGAPYGELPDLSMYNPAHDCVFTFNGTTSGVRLPREDPLSWVPSDREGLTLCDATSAVFAMEMDWAKQDITTFSWQKVLGGEGAHGVLILSPRAVERLETYRPRARPMPKIFRMTKPLPNDPSADDGRVAHLDRSIFDGATINTPSMMCVEDCLDALRWVESIGGWEETLRRSEENLRVVEDYIDALGRDEWLQFLAKDPATRSNTSVCLTMPMLSPSQVKWLSSSLEQWGVAFDCNSYKSAPPGIRIWCGATVQKSDVQALMPWLEYGHGLALEQPV